MVDVAARLERLIPADRMAEFSRRGRITELALFGSVLRDDFRAGSDVDVLVEFEPDARVVCYSLDNGKPEHDFPVPGLEPGTPVPELTPAALDELRRYAWPGNVRELENTMQRALIMCRGGKIAPHHFLLRGGVPAESGRADDAAELGTYEEAKQAALEVFQRRFLQRVLERTRGNVTQAADLCGLTRVAMQKLMRKLQLDREDFHEA